jgi:hypothetical protein
VITTIPVGQLPQALVYVRDATTSEKGTSNLKPLGPATGSLHLELVPPAKSKSAAHASVVINSLGLIDLLQIAATGLEPGKKYRLILKGDSEPQELVVLTASISGAAIAQTVGPLKRIAPSQKGPALKLEVIAHDSGNGDLILQQAAPPTTSR